MKKTVLIVSFVAALSATSGCEIIAPEPEVIDPAAGAVAPAAPVGPRPSVEPRRSGSSGGGGWGG